MLFAVIDFTEDAKEACAFDSWNLRIFIYEGNQLIESMEFNQANHEKVKSMEMPIYMKTDTSRCNIPSDMILFGRLRIR